MWTVSFQWLPSSFSNSAVTAFECPSASPPLGGSLILVDEDRAR
jgi:hypothetical protein